jgi:hypothetical protein
MVDLREPFRLSRKQWTTGNDAFAKRATLLNDF